MSEFHYTAEKNVQVVVSLLKAYGIKRIVASPGATNVTFVVSVQFDPFFDVYSCVDERSAAYMACGIADETGEPVALSCTGATSSRNYMPGLTEAYYRKLPVLAITSSQEGCRLGHLIPQVTDRTTPPSDVVLKSFQIGLVKDDVDFWDCTIKANAAMSQLSRRGGGPVHINLETRQSRDYFVKSLPIVKKIDHYSSHEKFPTMAAKKIAIFIGSHRVMSNDEQNAIDTFCEARDAVVLCDQTSGYHGRYKILSALILGQKNLKNESDYRNFDLVIHIGEISGDYFSHFKAKEVWRVNEDGEIRDTFHSVSKVFEVREIDFFSYYANGCSAQPTNLYTSFKECYDRLVAQMPELPFSNAYIAKVLAPKIPANSYLHLGILNHLRSWNLFEVNNDVICRCNVGGFGIDGVMSTVVGGAIVNKDKLHFCILGDLSFFYDMNSIGNHHIGNNLRILLINNGRGIEFHTSGHVGDVLHEETDKYIAAAGHFGCKSEKLVKHFAEDLGFTYISAKNKEEFDTTMAQFVAPTGDKSIIFEVFTSTADEHEATKMITRVDGEPAMGLKSIAKSILPDSAINTLKSILKK